ncbi:hypothetical protein [Nonomuraea jiangxiensis]|uniref:HNH endonuclease n=1 Tax=Nonomuraea jiangxiensis TaxID=633440 RepID=A0A1G9LS88_9ACTN|nr:hypothetical protein [Nonomuraea jiangxiensis]SDL64808.1 hypothetical protein SAMN05421869_12899 [Nonomuraea jiangxiensis]
MKNKLVTGQTDGKPPVKRLSPTKETLRWLFSFSGNECAFPDCTSRLINPDGTFIAQVCHIEAAERGGERFNEQMSNEDRRAASNLMLMCHEHHVVTNDVQKYTVEVLRAMKDAHEAPFRDGLQDMLARVVDWTETTTVTPARTLRAYLAYHGWDDDDDPESREGNVAVVAEFAETIRGLSRPAREMLVILLQRGRELSGQLGFGATYGVLLQEIVDATGLTWEEMISRVGQLVTRNLAKIEDEDWDFHDFVGPYVTTRQYPDLHWDDILTFCQANDVPLKGIFVNLRFDLLDDPTSTGEDQTVPI